ncbi:MAG: hypothetical protein JWM56_326 [Candidatus Peribacteria bacterium]|nr:hypothetical protein [Candidatus Peribacteria bacterium]
MGHVHLKIGTIEQAQKFYIDTIGFSMTARMPSALFMSINKYHHHLGMNSWESEGADKRPETLGLKEFTIMLPESSYVDALQKRLRNAELEPERTDTQLIFSDPWNNRIIVSTPFAEPVT